MAGRKKEGGGFWGSRGRGKNCPTNEIAGISRQKEELYTNNRFRV
jgi:hypothetical protein